MRQTRVWALAAFGVFGLACGGGGGSGADDCAHFATYAATCGATEPPAYEEGLCNAITCTGSKSDAIGCLLKLPCSASDAEMLACVTSQGCTVPKSCGDVADALVDCDGSLDWDSTYSGCTSTTCTGNLFTALACGYAVASTCSASMETDFNACVTAQGCPAVFQ